MSEPHAVRRARLALSTAALTQRRPGPPPQASESDGEEEEEAPKGRADAPTRWAKSFGTVVHDVLADCDGVCTRLYYYLWRKNAAGRTPTEFRIPDTVRGEQQRARRRGMPRAPRPR